MAFISIPSTLIQVGKPLIKLLFDYIKDDLDDLDSRVGNIEGSAFKRLVYDHVVRTRGNSATLTGFNVWRVPENFDLTDAKVIIGDITGSYTGDLEFDIRKSSSRDFTTSVSVFTTRPSIDMSAASDYQESNNAVFDTNNNQLVEGDWLRLDITSMPSPRLNCFHVYLLGE